MARSGLLSTKGGRRTRRVFQKIPRKGGIRRKRVDYKNVSIFTLESKHPWTCMSMRYSILVLPARHVRLQSNDGFCLRPKTIEKN